MKTRRQSLACAAAAFTVGALALSFAAESTARACSPPTCVPASVAPRLGKTVPANVPALTLLTVVNYVSQDAGEAVARVTLVGPDGVDVPITRETADNRFYLLKPNAALTPGATYHLRSIDTCEYSGMPKVGESSFTTGPEVAAPTATGTLSASRGMLGQIANPGGASCVEYIKASIVRLNLAPSAEVLAYQAVTSFETRVDGKPWGSTRHGDAFEGLDSAGPASDAAGGGLTRVYGGASVLYRTCEDARETYVANSLAAGAHTVEVIAHVAGVETPISAATATVTIPDCNATTTSLPGDGEIKGDVNGVGDSWGEGGSAGGVHDLGDDTSGSAGCSASPSPNAGPVGALAVALGAVAVALARTRMRRARRGQLD